MSAAEAVAAFMFMTAEDAQAPMREQGPKDRPSFQDLALGRVTWGTNGWNFRFPLGRGRQGRGTIIASAPEPRPAADCQAAVKDYVQWFRRKDTTLRAYIANKMFAGWRSGWYDPEIDRTRTRLGFQRKLSLSGINFYWDEPWVSVVYDDGGLFGGHGIALTTTYAGKIDGDPMMFG